ELRPLISSEMSPAWEVAANNIAAAAIRPMVNLRVVMPHLRMAVRTASAPERPCSHEPRGRCQWTVGGRDCSRRFESSAAELQQGSCQTAFPMKSKGLAG